MPIVCQVVAPEAVVVVVGKSNWFFPKIIFNMGKKLHTKVIVTLNDDDKTSCSYIQF